MIRQNWMKFDHYLPLLGLFRMRFYDETHMSNISETISKKSLEMSVTRYHVFLIFRLSEFIIKLFELCLKINKSER